MKKGGVVAYPTEGVFGFGCLPNNPEAIFRILSIKNRNPDMGLIIIASDLSQIQAWASLDNVDIKKMKAEKNHVTWLIEKTKNTPYWLSGKHSTIAIRLTKHPTVRALCNNLNSALISTSANISGKQTPKNSLILRRVFRNIVDYIVPGHCFKNTSASTIKNIKTGEVLR